MAPDAGGDSLHIGLDGQTTSDADQLTGFAANEWGWSRLTMDNTTASLSIAQGGHHTFDLWMREDGLRVDKRLLTTDANYLPDGEGPPESARQAITGTTTLQSVVIDRRNLLITHMTYISGTGWVDRGKFRYEGASHRLQQVDYSGGAPFTTT